MVILVLSQETPAIPTPPKKRRRWWRRLLYFCAAVIALLVWLNGPGIRWLLPKIATKVLVKKNIVTSFEVKGSILGGLSIHQLDVFGGPLVNLKISEIRPEYYWREVLNGKVRGVVLRDIKLDLDLDRKFPDAETPKAPTQPFDLAAFIDTIRQQQPKLASYNVDITTADIHIRRSATTLATIAPSAVRHSSGSNDWNLQVGEIVLPDQQGLSAQSLQLQWQQEQITLDRLALPQELLLHDLTMSTPADLRTSLTLALDALGAQFSVKCSDNFEKIAVQLRNGKIDFADVGSQLKKQLPVQGSLESFDLLLLPKNLPIHGKEEPPIIADASIKLQLADVTYETYVIDQCAISFAKTGTNAEMEIKATTMGTAPELRIEQLWQKDPSNLAEARTFSNKFTLTIAELQPLLQALSPKLKLEENLPAPPLAALRIAGSSEMNEQSIGPVQADISLQPQDPVTPAISLQLTSADLNAIELQGHSEGLTWSAAYDVKAQSYEANVGLTDFHPHLFAPWLDWCAVKIPEGMESTLSWSGAGDLLKKTHTGKANIAAFHWKRENADNLQVVGHAAYDWPKSATVNELSIRMGNQEARLDAQLEQQILTISRLNLAEGGKDLINGMAKIPVPEQIKGIDDFLQQTQAMDVSLHTEVLPLATLERWMPKQSPLPVTGTVKLDLQLSGSPAEPLISGDLVVKDVKSRDRSDLPSLDLLINLVTAKKQLQLSGQLLSPRTPPVTLSARMPFHPGPWSKNPASIQEETIAADIVIPQLELARFQDMIPQVKDLKGLLDGAVKVTGKVSSPVISGRLDLNQLNLTIPNEKVPPIRDGSVHLTFADRKATLSSMQIQLAGGDLKASGSMEWPTDGQAQLDFSLKGNALPLWRDTAVIARANADIRVAGPWDAVKISGPIRIVDSLLYKDFEIIPIGKPFTLPQAASLPALDPKIDAKVASLPDPFGKWAIDVSVKTQDPFLIRGNLARGSISVDMKIGGTVGNPQPQGKAVIDSLSAALPLSKLTISSGTVSLSPSTGMDPQLDIRGASRVSNHDVSIYVYGAVSAPKLLLTSEPPLPENEIMTLLATGTTTSGLTDAETAQGKGTQLLIEEFRRGRLPLGRRLMPLLSQLEDVEITVGEPDPYSGQKRASAKVPIRANTFLYGGVDGEGKTRTMFMFEWKFR